MNYDVELYHSADVHYELDMFSKYTSGSIRFAEVGIRQLKDVPVLFERIIQYYNYCRICASADIFLSPCG